VLVISRTWTKPDLNAVIYARAPAVATRRRSGPERQSRAIGGWYGPGNEGRSSGRFGIQPASPSHSFGRIAVMPQWKEEPQASAR
jgi:hypothetical protein